MCGVQASPPTQDNISYNQDTFRLRQKNYVILVCIRYTPTNRGVVK